MHVWCCDITYDVTASLNDVTLTNKVMHFRSGASEACVFENTPKMAVIDIVYMIGSTQSAGCSTQCHIYIGVSMVETSIYPDVHPICDWLCTFQRNCEVTSWSYFNRMC